MLSLRLPRNITQGSADPCAIPVVLVKQCLPCRALLRFCQHSRSGLQLQTGLQLIQRSSCRAANLQSFAAARHFCSAKILAGDCGGDGVPAAVENAPPAQRNFRGNLLCAASVIKSIVPRRLSAQKYVTTPDWKNLCTGQPGVPEGPRSLCFGKSPEEPLSRGSFGQLLRGGSTPRFFSQIRSVGSKPTRLAGHCQSAPGPWTTGPPPPAAGRQQSPPLRPAGAKKGPASRQVAFLFPNYSSSSPAGASSARMDSEIRLCS